MAQKALCPGTNVYRKPAYDPTPRVTVLQRLTDGGQDVRVPLDIDTALIPARRRNQSAQAPFYD